MMKQRFAVDLVTGEDVRIVMNQEQVLLSEDGKVVLATVEYEKRDTGVHAHVYAPMSEVPRELPLPGSATFAEQIQSLWDAGRLVLVEGGDLRLAKHLFRVVDNRTGSAWQVSFDRGQAKYDYEYGRVYVYHPNGLVDPEAKEFPQRRFLSVESFWSVLPRLGSYVHVTSIDELGGATTVSESPLRNEEYVVFNRGEMARSAR